MQNISQDNQLINLERARTAQEKAVVYRSGKRWKIFSWSSSMLIGSIAGAVAIETNSLDCATRIVLCFAVIILAAYTIFWLDINRRHLDSAKLNLKAIDDKLATYSAVNIQDATIPKWLKMMSYELTITLLAIISILMILLPCLPDFF